MDPVTLALLAGGTSLATGLIGNEQASGDRSDARNQINEILNMYKNMSTPDINQMRVNLAQQQDVYNYNPQAQIAEQLGNRDALEDVQLDPRLRQQQVKSLDLMNEIAGKGFTPDQLVAMDQQRRQNEGDLTSHLKGLQDQQAARGVGNSDFGLAQKMMEAQSSANRQAQDNAAMRASAYKNGLDAISQGANLAGNIGATDYAHQSALANAKNNREMLNMQQRSNVNQNNVQNFNDALKTKAANAQSIANTNVGLSNQQQSYNKGLLQQDFENQLKKAKGVADARTESAGASSKEGQAKADMWAGIGSGLSSTLLGAGGIGKKA